VHATPVAVDGSSRRAKARLVLGTIAGLVGLVWILQGLGVPIGRGSFMIGDIFWTWAGLAVVLGAIAYVAWPRLRRR
jgi:hypothetical protein